MAGALPEESLPSADRGRRLRTRAFLLLKTAISVGLVAWLAQRFSWPAVLAELKRLPWAYPVAAYLAVIGGYTLFAARLKFLLAAQSICIGFFPLLRITFVALLFGNVLPSSMGGDAVKIAILFRHKHHRRSHLALSVVADRFLNSAATLLLLLLVFSLPDLLSPFFALAPRSVLLLRVGMPVGGLLVVAGFLLVRRRLGTPDDQAPRPGNPSVSGRVKRALRTTVANWAASPGTLLLALAISILSTLVFYAAGWLLGRGLGLSLRAADWIALQCLLAAVGILPISINGLGVQEASVVYLLTRLGASPEQGMAFALLNRVLFVAASLPGAAAILSRGDADGAGQRERRVGPEPP